MRFVSETFARGMRASIASCRRPVLAAVTLAVMATPMLSSYAQITAGQSVQQPGSGVRVVSSFGGGLSRENFS
jgi:hypothetical protein